MPIRPFLLATEAAAFALAALPGATVPAAAQGRYGYMSCDQLWQARNAIYARRGYCFETPRARAVFGPGCFPPYGRLSPGEQQRVNEIQWAERQNRCPRY